jgi:hypothetical protein
MTLFAIFNAPSKNRLCSEVDLRDSRTRLVAKPSGTPPQILSCIRIQMRKYLCALYLLPALLVAVPSTNTKADDVIVEDDADPNATVTYVTLKWYENPGQNIAGYNVYYGLVSGDYTRLKSVADTTAMIGVKGSKTVYFAVTAYNTDGAESAFSGEVHWP